MSTRRVPRALSGALVAALVATGCAADMRPPRVGERPPTASDPEHERAYQAVLEKYSDREEVYSAFDTRMLTAVTFLSWPFREARAKRQAEFRHETAAELEQALAREKTEAEAAHVFHFGAHVNDYRHDDFDRKDSVWRVVLITSAGELKPTKIERLGRSSLDSRAIYPYLDDFWVSYGITFPLTTASGAPTIPPQDTTVTVRMASSLGKAEFTVPAR